MNPLSRTTLILSITLGIIVSDQATKLIAKRYLWPNGFYSYAGDIFRLQYAENSGAFLGLGATLPDGPDLYFELLDGMTRSMTSCLSGSS